jgi:DNA-directed RNA polymerase subunit RPC12/RpoP
LFLGVGCGKGVASTLPTETGGRSPNNKCAFLILQVAVCVKMIFEMGKEFPWPRPHRCPRCRGRVWGHGFTQVCFDGFQQPVWLRRYRCPDCGVVIRMRPDGYFSRFQTPVTEIRSRLSERLRMGRWPPGMSHRRQGHWLRALKRRVLACLGQGWVERLMEGFERLLGMGQIPVSRSI